MIGKTISHYKIIEELGAGGMGVVYKAQDTKLKRTLALKFLPSELTRDPDANARFEREAQAAAALNHSNIITIYEIGEHEGQTYIAMEYVAGKTLRMKIEKGKLKNEDVVDFTKQICEGLAKAHQAGIVHRDIKPENILIDSDGRVKILDFGLAKLKGTGKLTKDTSTLGTINYMSPEQARGEDVDQRTDIWSLGVVLYEMLTGELPFKGEYEQAAIYSILNEEPQANVDINSEIAKIVNKCLAKQTENRYQTIEELANELKHGTIENRTSSAKKLNSIQKRSIVRIGAFALIALIIAGFFIFMLKSSIPNGNEQWVNSIAVLPFIDLSQDKSQDHFCMGMTEQILSNLAKLNDLKVIARTSVMKYINTQKSISEIADDLDVRNILEGSIQRAGDEIRITVKLINASTGAYLWSENYDSRIQDIFSVQDEVSQKVANVLNIKLNLGKYNDEKDYETKNTEAYEYCLKGEYLSRYFILGEKHEEHLSLFLLAEDHFKKSLQLDPLFTRAKLGLADHYLSFYFLHGDNERVELAREYANEVITSDPKNVFAMALMGGYYYEMDEFDTAIIYFKQALQLNPNAGKANYYMALFYNSKGLYFKSKIHLEKAVQIDPLNTLYLFYCGLSFQNLGLYDEAEQYYNKMLEFNPDHVMGRWMLVWIKLYTKKYAEAEKLFEEHSRMFPDFELNYIAQSRIYAINGKKEKALALEDSSVYNYLLLNMKEEAIKRLKIGIESNSPATQYDYLQLIHHPWFECIRDDPRFIDIVAQQKKVYESNLQKYGDLN